MSVEVESAGQLEEFLRVIKKRAWWIVVPLVIATSLGVAFAVVVPRKYVSKTTVLVRDVSGLVQQSKGTTVSSMEGSVAPHLIRSHVRVGSVLTTLHWADYLMLGGREAYEYRQELINNIGVNLPSTGRNSGQQLVDISFAHTDGRLANEFLTELVNKWKTEVLDRFRDTERRALGQYREQQAKLQRERREISERATQLRRTYKLQPPDPLRARRGEVATARTFELRDAEVARLEELEREIESAESALALLEAKHDRAPEMISPDQLDDPRGLDRSTERLRELEIRRKDLEDQIARSGWTSQHSKYEAARDMIQEIDREMLELRAAATVPIETGDPGLVRNPARFKLAADIEDAEISLAELKSRRDRLQDNIDDLNIQSSRLQEVIAELQELEDRRAEIQAALEEIEINKGSQESKVTILETDAGNPFEDIQVPTEPTKPTEPNPMMIVSLAVILGLTLGLAMAILGEYSRSCFRSPREVARLMVVPVLGTVNSIVTRRQLTRRILARTALAGGTLAFAVVVGYLAWAWTYRKEALSDSVVQAIESLREQFM